MKSFVIFLTILGFGFNSFSQKVLKIDFPSKKEIQIYNYYHNRLNFSNTSSFEFKVNLEYSSDSLIIYIKNSIPVTILNLDFLKAKEFCIKFPEIPLYESIDTLIIHETITKRITRRKVKKMTLKTPNNSNKLDSFPQEIEVVIDNKNYKGFLYHKHQMSFMNADGKRYSSETIIYGFYATYLIKIN